jgi:hypothetical protein
LFHRGKVLPVFLAALTLATGGCVVSTSRFDAKVREADALRDALASVNREKTSLESRMEALSGNLADETERSEKCDAQARKREQELQKLREDYNSASRNYEGTRITREQFITELLEKEKASGKRIQELNARSLACETERETLRRDSASMKQKIAGLQKRIDEIPDGTSLRMERDILAGRVVRLQEEKRLAEQERGARFAKLARELSAISPEVDAVPIGPVLRLRIPDNLLLDHGTRKLSDPAAAILRAVATSATALPTATIVVTAEEPKIAESIRALLAGEKNLSGERIVLAPGGREKGSAELLLIVP